VFVCVGVRLCVFAGVRASFHPAPLLQPY